MFTIIILLYYSFSVVINFTKKIFIENFKQNYERFCIVPPLNRYCKRVKYYTTTTTGRVLNLRNYSQIRKEHWVEHGLLI